MSQVAQRGNYPHFVGVYYYVTVIATGKRQRFSCLVRYGEYAGVSVIDDFIIADVQFSPNGKTYKICVDATEFERQFKSMMDTYLTTHKFSFPSRDETDDTIELTTGMTLDYSIPEVVSEVPKVAPKASKVAPTVKSEEQTTWAAKVATTEDATADAASGKAYSMADLFRMLAERDKIITHLRSEISERDAVIEKLRGEIAALCDEIAKLREASGGSDKTTYYGKYKDLKEKVTQLKEEITQLKITNAFLKGENATYVQLGIGCERIQTARVEAEAKAMAEVMAKRETPVTVTPVTTDGSVSPYPLSPPKETPTKE